MQQPWWGQFTFGLDEVACWAIGQRKIVLQRLLAEWHIWDVESAEQEGYTLLEQSQACQNITLDDAFLSRHLFTKTDTTVKVLPALADRAITSRANRPLHLQPGEQGRLFVSTPLWFQVYTGANEALFFDKPFWRPSDSWFGASTIEGELCYSKHTEARVSLDKLERRSHRAITPVNVVNDSDQLLVIDRFNLPVPMLSLYSDESGFLWTEALTVKRENDEESVALTFDTKAPIEAKNAKLVASPRIEQSKHKLIRSLSSLFA